MVDKNVVLYLVRATMKNLPDVPGMTQEHLKMIEESLTNRYTQTIIQVRQELVVEALQMAISDQEAAYVNGYDQGCAEGQIERVR